MKTQDSLDFFGRSHEFAQVQKFIQDKKAGITFLRGRRRVGKSALLKHLKELDKSCFYFMGSEDASDLAIRKLFSSAWVKFCEDQTLAELAKEHLTWRRIFEEISKYLTSHKQAKTVIILDEIQWLAKKNSGVLSLIKEFWLEWKSIAPVKLIICGSSNKFFDQYVEGGEKILRGLKTRASIWVPEFTPAEVKKFFFPNWKPQEVCLVYMLLGGVPYYLENIDSELGFIYGINQALFTEDSMFLEEIDEILNLEFNKQGRETVKKILRTLGLQGSTMSQVATKTKLSESTVYEALEKLLTYKLIFERDDLVKSEESKQSGKQHGTVYYIKDFYLNLFFSILDPMQDLIRNNREQLLFTAKVLQTAKGYYIPNFSGRAFELFIERLLEYRDHVTKLREKLLLFDPQYKIATYKSKECQIDLVVEGLQDRISRVIECKWVGDRDNLRDLIKETAKKTYPCPKQYAIKRYLIVGWEVDQKEEAKARESGVELIGVGDLVG